LRVGRIGCAVVPLASPLREVADKMLYASTATGFYS
jgi:hypothetical protein